MLTAFQRNSLENPFGYASRCQCRSASVNRKKDRGRYLNDIPGKHFEYATINYYILGAINEKVSGNSFEEYMENSILFRKKRRI